jgi:hypothetical protein
MDLRIRGVVTERHDRRVSRNEMRQTERDNRNTDHHGNKTY